MKLIFCKSKNNGIWFIDRRQSSDKVLINKIVEDAKLRDATIWISEYSRKLFEQTNYEKISIINEELVFHQNDIVFIEDLDLTRFLNRANELTIVDWNRNYPATKFFNESLDKFELKNKYELVGNSHKEIIIENYDRKDDKNEEK